MIKLISILFVVTIILGVAGVTVIMLQQRQKRHKRALQQFAQQLQFKFIGSEAEIKPVYDQLSHFDFFQQGSSSRIRALIQGNDRNTRVQIIIAALTHSGVNQSYTDDYAAIALHDDQLRLPHFKLQPQENAVARALNTALADQEPQVSLADYPTLADKFQLTGTHPETIQALFAQGLGSYLNSLVEQSVYRSVEGRNTQILFYTYLRKEVQIEELRQLYEEGRQVLTLLEPATIS